MPTTTTASNAVNFSHFYGALVVLLLVAGLRWGGFVPLLGLAALSLWAPHTFQNQQMGVIVAKAKHLVFGSTNDSMTKQVTWQQSKQARLSNQQKSSQQKSSHDNQTKEASKMRNANCSTSDGTLLKVLTLDRSGSMQSFGNEMRNGVNTFIKKVGNNNPDTDTLLSIITFDDKVDEPLREEFLALPGTNQSRQLEVKAEWIEPRGTTALLDGILAAVERADEIVASRGISPFDVEVVIFTDGHENASRKISRSGLNDVITKRKAEGYVFTFLAANQDAIATAAAYGFDADRSMTVSAGKAQQMASWSACAQTPMKAAFSTQIRQASCTPMDARSWGTTVW